MALIFSILTDALLSFECKYIHFILFPHLLFFFKRKIFVKAVKEFMTLHQRLQIDACRFQGLIGGYVVV